MDTDARFTIRIAETNADGVEVELVNVTGPAELIGLNGRYVLDKVAPVRKATRQKRNAAAE